MFVAIDQNRENHFAFHEDKTILKSLSSNKELYCPHCQKNVFFRGGSKRIHHFYHEAHVECSYTGEPETQEHLSGKLAIYNWLKKQYPNADIALEKRIIKTHQIADVYVDFGNEQIFAFEIQCAELSVEKWIERHRLYKLAGIKDIWLFGYNYYKEIKSNNENDVETILRLKYLQQVINRIERSVYFIDVKNNTIKHIGHFFGISFPTKTSVFVQLQEIQIDELKVHRIISPCKYVLANTPTFKKIQKYFQKRQEEAADFWKERKEERLLEMQRQEEVQKFELQQMKIFKMKREKLESYRRYLNNFTINKVLSRMSNREQIIFKGLVKEYNLIDTNFPGIFNIQLENYSVIKTPYPLWQLLVFHNSIKQNYSKKQLVFPKVLFQDIKEKIRYDKKDSIEVANLIHDYLILLEKCGFISKNTYTRKYKHPFAIKNKDFPIINDKNFNTNVAIYLSEFNLSEISWNEYYTFQTTINDNEQKLLKKSIKRYQELIQNKIDSPPQIDEGLIYNFYKAALNKQILLNPNEFDFLVLLQNLILKKEFVSQTMYDTFLALMEDKVN